MMAQARSIAVSLTDKRKNEDGSNGANALVMNAGTENDTVAAGVSSSILEEYIGCCASMGLRPSSVVLRMVLEHQAAPQRLTTLQLHHTYMGDSGTAALGRCLATTLPFLRALSLANNGVGNDGVAALSAGISEKARLPAVHAGQVLPLLVLDLSHNSKITRAGGQALLNTASRISSRLSLISLVGTRVTDYFESRIIRHCANTFDALSENDQQLVYDLGRELGLIADDDAAQMATGAGSRSDSVAGGSALIAQLRPTGSVVSDAIRAGSHVASASPHFLDRDGDLGGNNGRDSKASPSHLGFFPGRHSSTGNSFDGIAVRRGESSMNAAPTFTNNAPFDEAWYADEEGAAESVDDDVDVVVEPRQFASASGRRTVSVLDVLRPSAPSGLETILYSSTPDFLQVFSEDATTGADGQISKRYTITTMPGRERTVYGFTTPGLYEVEIFQYVEAYKPKTIELPAAFYFPGTLDYQLAIHGPDPMLRPAMPSLASLFPPLPPALASPSGGPTPAQKVKVPAPPALPASGSTTPIASSPFVGSSSAPPNPPPLPLTNLYSQAHTAAGAAGGAGVGPSSDSDSMFWSFFHSANAAPGTPRDARTPNNATPRSHQPLITENAPPLAPPLALPPSSVAGTSTSVGGHHTHHAPHHSSVPTTSNLLPRSIPAPPPTTMSAVSSTAGTPVAGTPEERHLIHGAGTPAPSTPDILEGSPVASPTGNASFSSASNLLPFYVGNTATNNGGGVEVPPINLSFLQRHPSTTSLHALPRAPLDPLALHLGRVNEAALGAKAMLSSKYASYPLPSEAAKAAALESRSKSLSELLRDPEWAPGRPTRPSQIGDYCAHHKLKFDSVIRERMKPSRHNVREYTLQRIIRPSITDSLSAGAMNTLGTMLLTSNYDMTCKVWDLETGKKIHTLRGHSGHLSDCAWNLPICDKVLTSSFDKTLKVWDVVTGNLLHTLRGHELEVVCVAVSPSGRQCASGGMDDVVIVWDIDSGIESFNFTGHTAEIISLDFSPLGDLLVSGSMDETVRLWNVLDGSCLRTFEGHTAEIGQVKFNCFGNVILSGSIDGTCKLWDVKTGKHKTLRGHTHEVVDCDFAPDGWICASASDDGTVRVWDVLSGGCLMLIVGHERGICRLAFNGDGKELITGSLDTTAKVWNVETGECKQTLRGHKGLVLVTYNSTTEKILTLSRDNTCRIWQREPELNTLYHSVAVAMCSNPTMYSEAVFSQTLPVPMVQYLHRVYRKVFRATEETALTAPTPLPSMRSPHPDMTVEEVVDLDDSTNPATTEGDEGAMME